MIARRQPVDLAPLPRKGAAHWWRVHFEADRRAPLPSLPRHPNESAR